ncbi:hypothetical protein ACWD0G_12885 [Streptomyces goshikiensis]
MDRRLDHGPAAGPVVRPLVLDLLRSGPVAVRAAPAAVLAAPGGDPAHTLRGELARTDPAFGALVARWLADAAVEAAALLGPGARRTVETLGRAAWDVT